MPRRFGRPGLIGTMARTAVIAGTASATVNAVNGRAQQKAMAQQQQAAQQQQMGEMQQPMAAMQAQAAAAPTAAPPTAPTAPAQGDLATQLAQLKSLADQGLITPEEYEAKRRQLLGI